jgi:hypothetical protein
MIIRQQDTTWMAHNIHLSVCCAVQPRTNAVLLESVQIPFT